MKKLPCIAILITIMYWFHLLRNLSSIYFFLLGLFIFFAILLKLQTLFKVNRLNFNIFIIFILWVYATIATFFQQLQSNDSVLIGIIRFWSVFPLIYVAAELAKYSVIFRMRLFVIFYIIAAATLPLQYIFGSIEWFAESSSRAGADRFASLTGSLTSFGVSLGVAGLAALCFLPKSISGLVFIFLALGGILTLQKAALANIFLALIFFIWIKDGSLKSIFNYLLRFAIFTFLVIFISIFISKFSPMVSYLLDLSFRITSGVILNDVNLSDDVGFFQSIYDRVTELPLLAISYYRTIVLVFGAGVFGAAGSLGYPDIPMAHNGIVEIILIFGVPLGLLINFYLIVIIVKFFLFAKNSSDAEIKFISMCTILFYINNIFSGGGFFQPISAFIFWSIFFRAQVIVNMVRFKQVSVIKTKANTLATS